MTDTFFSGRDEALHAHFARENRTLRALEFHRVLEHLQARCLSESGKAAALELRPLSDLATVHKAQLLLEEVAAWRAEQNFTPGAFPELGNVLELLNAHNPLLEPEVLWGVKECLSIARKAIDSLKEGQERRPTLSTLLPELPVNAISALNRCIGDDGQIKDESSPGLILVRNEMRSLNQSCLRRVKEYAATYNIAHYLQDEYMTLASDRYVLPFKANFKGRLQGVIHDYSKTGETLYFEPMFLVEQNNRLQELKHQEREEELKVLRLLCNLLVQEMPQMKATWNFLVWLDVALAKNSLGQALDARIVPLFEAAEGQRVLHLLGARHPLLVLERNGEKAKFKVEPVDITLRPEDRILVISGGNAGGKTVALKTLGLIALMTLSGLPAPVAAGSTLPAWNRVNAFIGDEQSLDDSVSTFTGQITHLAKVWDSLGPDSLVLLDEFGAGTDPAQGAALAQAVLDGLLEKRAFAVTATHFPALKTYALTHEGVRTASVIFDERTKKPLYHLAYDQVGASQALDVAREHGLPDSVLRRAEQYLLLDGEDSGVIVTRLNALAREREEELEELRQRQLKVENRRKQLEERFEKEKLALHAEVREKSHELMNAWKAGKATAKQALKDMSRLRASLHTPAAEAAPAAPQALAVGQQVKHIPWNKRAQVVDVDERGGRVRLDMNGVSMWAAMGDVSLAGQVSQALPSSVRANVSRSPVFLRLDLRGKRADEALAELEQFLDRSLLSGPDGVEVVHGRGTGALRKSVHEFLAKFPGLASFACAPEDQGGDGVTLVTFR